MSTELVLTTTGRRSLALALDSIVRQELRAGDEILLVHDGTPGREVEDLWRRSGLPGQLIFIADGPHGDWGHTPRNRTIALASGDHVQHFDDDDVYLPGALRAVREAACAHSAAFLVFKCGWPTE